VAGIGEIRTQKQKSKNPRPPRSLPGGFSFFSNWLEWR